MALGPFVLLVGWAYAALLRWEAFLAYRVATLGALHDGAKVKLICDCSMCAENGHNLGVWYIDTYYADEDSYRLRRGTKPLGYVPPSDVVKAAPDMLTVVK